MKGSNEQSIATPRARWILTAPLLFFTLYLGAALLSGDFYALPVSVAFMAASVWGLSLFPSVAFSEKLEAFSRGAAHRDIMMMIWIFIMAGAFAESARALGAVDATVAITLHFMPTNMLPAGLFLAACLISFSIGTSVGAIAALMPVAVGLAEQSGFNAAMICGIVAGGAFFGDNLSFISDTTIAATRTQGCAMQDKFRANFRVALPAAVLTVLIYVVRGQGGGEALPQQGELAWGGAVPYLAALIPALVGVHVLIALCIGIFATGALTMVRGGDVSPWLNSLGQGALGMGELICVTLLAGGLLGLIRHYGGIVYLVQILLRGMRGRRTAELGIALMVSLSNLCTANNTVAILTVGDITRVLAEKFRIPPERAACLLDTFSCLAQGTLPYGAQLLMAARLSGLNVAQIIPELTYPMLLGACALISIFLPGRTASAASQ